MAESSHTIRPAQFLRVLALCMSLFFVIAFAHKSIEAHKLGKWREDLRAEVAQMEQQRENLEKELARRDSEEWSDQILREAGWVPEGVVRVIAIPEIPQATGATEPLIVSPPPTPTPDSESIWFNNPRWRAWQRLVLGSG